MGKENSDKIKSDEIVEAFADRIRSARLEAKRWKEYEAAQVDELKAYTDGASDVVYVTDSGDEVLAITETTPSVSYDYKAYFAAHPEHRSELEEKFAKEARSQTRITTNWVARN